MKQFYSHCSWALKLILKDNVCLYFPTVTCIIMQKNGAGLQTASACFWENSTDGNFTCSFWKIYYVLYEWYYKLCFQDHSLHDYHVWLEKAPKAVEMWICNAFSSVTNYQCALEQGSHLKINASFKLLSGQRPETCRILSLALMWKWKYCDLIYCLLHPTGSCAVRWENKSMYCIVNVFGLGIWINYLYLKCLKCILLLLHIWEPVCYDSYILNKLLCFFIKCILALFTCDMTECYMYSFYLKATKIAKTSNISRTTTAQFNHHKLHSHWNKINVHFCQSIYTF